MTRPETGRKLSGTDEFAPPVAVCRYGGFLDEMSRTAEQLRPMGESVRRAMEDEEVAG
jgi:hypothetical protein